MGATAREASVLPAGLSRRDVALTSSHLNILNYLHIKNGFSGQEMDAAM